MPPVWPRPRPEIIGTAPPQAATIGASISDTLSPTPPVECLSTTGRSRSQSITVPERVIALVSATRSPGSIPRRNSAIASAPTWASDSEPSVIPPTRNATSSALSSRAVALAADDLSREHRSTAQNSMISRVRSPAAALA